MPVVPSPPSLRPGSMTPRFPPGGGKGSWHSQCASTILPGLTVQLQKKNFTFIAVSHKIDLGLTVGSSLRIFGL